MRIGMGCASLCRQEFCLKQEVEMIAFFKNNVQEILDKFSNVTEYVQSNFLGKEIEDDEGPYPDGRDYHNEDLPLTLNKDPGPGIQTSIQG